jgi:hypothetical protein
MEWFNLVQKTILQFGIDPDKVYNFNETGFAIGFPGRKTARRPYISFLVITFAVAVNPIAKPVSLKL